MAISKRSANSQDRRRLLMKIEEDEQKRIIKDALKEWLDSKFMEFGKWTAMGIAALVLAALVYFVLSFYGLPK